MMNRLFLCVVLICSNLLNTADVLAQVKNTDRYFIPYTNEIFKDDFNNDPVGSFPKEWEVPPDMRPSGWNVTVVSHPRGNYMAATTPASNRGTLSIEPRMHDLDYIKDSFTLEFDFYLENRASELDIDFYSSTSADPFELIFHTVIRKEKKGYIMEYARWFNTDYKELIKLPAAFHYGSWHHLAFSYIGNTLKCYLDEQKYLSVSGHDHPISGMFFSFTSCVDIKNVSLARGWKKEPVIIKKAPVVIDPKPTPATVNPLNKILTESKFVTHAINFDVNESTIKSESLEFIGQLAAFLTANPSIRLEIDGHTDSDGDEDANNKLSQARADAVKDQLISMGINTDRLTTKGFGASVPLKPNNTPEGKAENRRVEFIKL